LICGRSRRQKASLLRVTKCWIYIIKMILQTVDGAASLEAKGTAIIAGHL
jgi:hypothetical protein